MTRRERVGHPRGLLVVLTAPPEVIVAVLRSAHSGEPDPRLNDVLRAFRREWEALGRRRYPALGDALEDALQTALLKIISPEKLDGLRDTERVAPWARSIFIHAAMDVARDLLRHRGQRLAHGPDEDTDEILRDRFPSATPNPEEELASRERVRIVTSCIERVEIAKLRFIEDLPEKDIADRLDLSRDGVAGQLKRIRKAIRKALEDSK